LNAQLVRVLREGPPSVAHSPLNPSDLSYQRHRRWKIRDRFSEDEIAQIVKAFKAGTPKHELAKRFGMNLRSLKKLLREEGVKRKSWKDVQA
jgi:DNA invertase Pin-like site-specific DNA recombinase